MEQRTIRANNLTFSYLAAGQGPLLLLLHGFPDNAHTWEHQIPAFAEAGYRVVAPFLRGYPPTEIPVSAEYDRATLALDIRELILALEGEPACIVSQDWGAAITYGVLAAFPELVKRAVTMAIPHPKTVRASLVSPAAVHRAFHWWFFQLPDLPEMSVSANNFAFLDYLWNYWSPGLKDADHLQRIKTMMAMPGALAATLGYYRAMFHPPKDHLEVWMAMEQPITVPTLSICGLDDIRGEVLEAQRVNFAGEYEFALVPDCGHFLHREKPKEVNRLVLEWLGKAG